MGKLKMKISAKDTEPLEAGVQLPENIHPFADLLELSPEEIVRRYRTQQLYDFETVLKRAGRCGGLLFSLPRLAEMLANDTEHPILRSLDVESMIENFSVLHEHVMGHPVWCHPFFRRFYAARMSKKEVVAFLGHYLNQVKNTRQCVALCCGRFHSLAPLPFGRLNEIVSELVQIVLATLLADEYGTEAHSVDERADLDIRKLTDKITHIVLYRQLYEMFDIPLAEQDTPLIPEVIDNVLVQRLLAGSEAFSELEALASVGLGMEWGVPAIFSMLLGGLIRFAEREGVEWSSRNFEVLTGHVHQDVDHGVAVMLVTSLFIREDGDLKAIKNATNILMSSRYEMMSGIYRSVFGESCPSIHDIDLPATYYVCDRRIASDLQNARERYAPHVMAGSGARGASQRLPFIFA